MPRPSDARQRLIETAARLFQRQGYDGTGLNQILQESGAPKGSFYYHFPAGKEALAEAAIDYSAARTEALIRQTLADAQGFNDGIRALVATFAAGFEKSGFASGCPVTSTLLATVPGSARLQTACNAALMRWCGAVADAARTHGHDRNADALAAALIATFEGAWVLARAQGSTAPFDAALEFMLAGLGDPEGAV